MNLQEGLSKNIKQTRLQAIVICIELPGDLNFQFQNQSNTYQNYIKLSGTLK